MGFLKGRYGTDLACQRFFFIILTKPVYLSDAKLVTCIVDEQTLILYIDDNNDQIFQVNMKITFI